MNTPTETVSFEALDACHRQIQENLASLAALARKVDADGIDAAVEQDAAAIEAFFSGTSRQHHADEEKFVFPPLLTGSDQSLARMVRMLKQDHGWIEENWIELAPQLRGIATGTHWVDPIEFVREVAIFTELCQGHIALEESMIYPESKARWAKTLESRPTSRPR